MLVKFLRSYEVQKEFRELSHSSRELKIAVAYLKKSGFESIGDCLEHFVRKKGRLKILVGLAEQYITDPEPLKTLLKLRRSVDENEKKRVQVRYYDRSNFHPKLLVFKGRERMAIILGSSNLTGGGLSKNIEANILLVSKKAEHGPTGNIDRYFDLIWRRKDGFGPLDLTEAILNSYAYNKRLHEQSKKAEDHKKKPVPASKFPNFKKDIPKDKMQFSLLLDDLKTSGTELEAFCTSCDQLVTINKKWIDYWVCEKHRGSKTAECPSPEEKGEKGGLIKLLVDDAEVHVKSIKKLCLTKGCKRHVDLTNDFYWLICARCYDKLDPGKRCRIPRSEDGFSYRLSCKDIWKS